MANLDIEITSSFIQSVLNAYLKTACPSALLRRIAETLESRINNAETPSQIEHAQLLVTQAAEIERLAAKLRDQTEEFYSDDLNRARDQARETAAYFTLLVPYVAPDLATEWHPSESTGPFSTLTRGNFKTEAEAHSWAKERLNNTPYKVSRVTVDGALSVVAYGHRS